MSENSESHAFNFAELAVDIAAAYVSNNSVRPTELSDLIRTIHAALGSLAISAAPTASEPKVEKLSAAQIRKSVTPDGIVSFLDGKTYKTLKRHLTSHGLDPQSYRVRFGLSADYPMVAQSYAAMRSDLAKSIGLGRVAGRTQGEQSSAGRRKKAA
ncbi:MucR family transcriptional regulator [Methylobacterium sp. M6A4_1b]